MSVGMLKLNIISLIVIWITVKAEENIYMCDSTNSLNYEIYCSGQILEAVNHAKIFEDSKDFVDMPLKFSPQETIKNFTRIFGKKKLGKINKQKLKKFINSHFRPAGEELLDCIPKDWNKYPKNFKMIKDSELRQWALSINKEWITLCKTVDEDVSKHPEKYSLISSNREVFVPGGRFREAYNWDSYWILIGMLKSGMIHSAETILLNFQTCVQRYGFVPNGARVYYMRRSHPPLFTPMALKYYEETKNKNFIGSILPDLEKELEYWFKNYQYTVTINNLKYTVYRYNTKTNVPRPESFQQDVDIAEKSKNPNKQQIYRDISSAAESGFDFTTRWFADKKNMETIETSNIIPVDLNAFIYWNIYGLKYFYEKVFIDKIKAGKYSRLLKDHKKAFDTVFYNETFGLWFDYNLRTKNHNTEFYSTLITPLFVGMIDDEDINVPLRMYRFFNKSGAFKFHGGVPSSMISDSGHQWDFPNAWGNQNHMIVKSFRKSRSPFLQNFALELAQKWVKSNYRVYNATGYMWEKYDICKEPPCPGEGGEYIVQKGFGLSNDLKPDNILLTSTCRVKIGDLGLSYVLGTSYKTQKYVCGTLHYSSPEKINEREYGLESDVWALGCIAFEMCAFVSPFAGEKTNIYALKKKVSEGIYPPLPTECYSKEILFFINSCLSLKPENRPTAQMAHKAAHIMFLHFEKMLLKYNRKMLKSNVLNAKSSLIFCNFFNP
uniref:Trehalase n=1 Tax=Panagrolaimus sp. PS1159 TaxID=55785 RepID=A0AC35F053_9BILA